VPFSHPLWLGAVGCKPTIMWSCGFDRADTIVSVGYDMVEYHPIAGIPIGPRRLCTSTAARPKSTSIMSAGGGGGTSAFAGGDRARLPGRARIRRPACGHAIVNELSAHADDASFPLKPQRIVWELAAGAGRQATVVCDVGAHKIWMARMYQPERPNACIISNGFASMGIGVRGHRGQDRLSERTVVAVTGDGGFMINSQEIENALPIGTPLVIVIGTTTAMD